MKIFNLVKIVSLIFLLFFRPHSTSCEVLYKSIPDLLSSSESIVEGVVKKIEYDWCPEKKYIYTYVYIGVKESYKNKISEREIIIRELGGSKDGVVLFVPHIPRYKQQENVLVFLKKEGNYYQTVGLEYGKFTKVVLENKAIFKRNVISENIEIDNNKSQYNYEELISLIASK